LYLEKLSKGFLTRPPWRRPGLTTPPEHTVDDGLLDSEVRVSFPTRGHRGAATESSQTTKVERLDCVSGEPQQSVPKEEPTANLLGQRICTLLVKMSGSRREWKDRSHPSQNGSIQVALPAQL
jgi:hypothetical protein